MRRSSLLLLGALAACSVGPDYVPPQPPATAAWNDASRHMETGIDPAANPDPLWWNRFGDPVLTTLMQQAIANNPSLRQALLRVVEARQQVVSAAAAGLPTLSGNASYMREQLGVKGILQSKGAYSELNSLADQNSPINTVSPGLGTKIDDTGTGLLDGLAQPVNLYQYGLSSSWELDLFGRVRRSVEQARASQQAQSDAANDALVMLESQVAQAYFQLRTAQSLAQAQAQNVQVAQTSLHLTENRYQRGLTSDLDVEQARTQFYAEQSQRETYEKQTGQAIDQINVLCGAPPGTLDATLETPAPLPEVPALVGIGLPSALARRRPDIREAEAQLHAATANVGVAVASFYPDISLTGSLGLRATDARFLTNWASLFYAAGPTISLPIFEGGTLTANLRTARAQQASAALNYRGTVLNALREVEDALVAYRTDQAAAQDAAATVQSADLSFYLANNLYTHGLSNYLNVLDSERADISARQQSVQANSLLDDDVVTLYTALGGGWQNTPVPTTTIPTAPPPLPAAIDSLAAP